MDFTKLNKVGRMESTFIPTRKFADLEKDVNLHITAVRLVNSKFGPAITVDVDNKYSTFLPKRIVKLITAAGDDTTAQMSHACAENRLFMRCVSGPSNMVEFQPDFANINQGQMQPDFLPTRKLADLEKDSNLLITSMRQVTTKFGPRIAVDVEDQYSTFLPQRIVKSLSEDGEETYMNMLDAIQHYRLFMRYLGGVNNNVEFVCI